MLPDDLITIAECAERAHVKKITIYKARAKGKVIFYQKPGRFRHYVSWAQYQDYMLKRYCREITTRLDGHRVFDLEAGRYSVPIAAKYLGSKMGYDFPDQKLYYLIRRGVIPARRIGWHWTLDFEDLNDYCAKQLALQAIQDERIRSL